MSDSIKRVPEAEIKVSTKDPKLTPPGYDLTLSEAQMQLITEFVSSPVFKVLKYVVVPQRKDHIARQCLNTASDMEWVSFYKGEATELLIFLKAMEKVKEKFKSQDKDEKPAT